MQDKKVVDEKKTIQRNFTTCILIRRMESVWEIKKTEWQNISKGKMCEVYIHEYLKQQILRNPVN